MKNKYTIQIVDSKECKNYVVETEMSGSEFNDLSAKLLQNASDIADFVVDLTVSGCELTLVPKQLNVWIDNIMKVT